MPKWRNMEKIRTRKNYVSGNFFDGVLLFTDVLQNNYYKKLATISKEKSCDGVLI